MTHIIHLDPSWQCNVFNGENVCVATGPTIEDALYRASQKARTGEIFGRTPWAGMKFTTTNTPTNTPNNTPKTKSRKSIDDLLNI